MTNTLISFHHFPPFSTIIHHNSTIAEKKSSTTEYRASSTSRQLILSRAPFPNSSERPFRNQSIQIPQSSILRDTSYSPVLSVCNRTIRQYVTQGNLLPFLHDRIGLIN